jgi:hypothetical protein
MQGLKREAFSSSTTASSISPNSVSDEFSFYRRTHSYKAELSQFGFFLRIKK